MEQKLKDGTGGLEARPATADEIREILGADAGSLGAVGVDRLRVIADPALRDRTNMTTGANLDDHHLRGVDVTRDIAVDDWIDLRLVRPGEPCPECGEPLEVFRAIEAGHIFKLGTKYSSALGATVLDAEGVERPLMMGSYGIGVERNLAAVVEVNHDDKGILWPMAVAPYEVVVTVLSVEDEATMEAGNRIYGDLVAHGVDVLIDDRAERPGVKFNDAELIGIPLRITVGPRGLADGMVEVVERSSGEMQAVPIAEAVDIVARRVVELR
jgi:prolyl-tRNA synthetase